jgi:hypothetical protein
VRVGVPDETQVNIKNVVCDSESPKSLDQGRFHCSHIRGEIEMREEKDIYIFHGNKKLLFEFIRFCKLLAKYKQGIMSDNIET